MFYHQLRFAKMLLLHKMNDDSFHPLKTEYVQINMALPNGTEITFIWKTFTDELDSEQSFIPSVQNFSLSS